MIALSRIVRRFSFAHSDNTIILKQYGVGNKVSWVPYWGSGKGWGGDVDGVSNDNTNNIYTVTHVSSTVISNSSKIVARNYIITLDRTINLNPL